jgi:hypothetical protein
MIAVGLPRVQHRVAALVREGAWEAHDGYWFIAGWFKWNDTTDKLRQRKKGRADGAARTNHQKHQSNGHLYVPGCLVCTGEVEAA